MFSRLYRKNDQGYYIYPLYNYPLIWFIGSVLICFLADYLIKLTDNDFIKFIYLVSFVVASISGIIEIIKLIIGTIKNKSMFKYFRALDLTSSIRKALLNTMTLNLYKDSPIIEVPGIQVVFEENGIKVTIF